jgi:hypothetical protein
MTNMAATLLGRNYRVVAPRGLSIATDGVEANGT